MSVTSESTLDSSYTGSQNGDKGNIDIVNAPPRNQKVAGNNGSLDLPGKIENFKAWSSAAMKCTKQAIEEKLGTTSPTRDPDIENKIEELKRIQAKYQEMNTTVKKMIGHLNAMTMLEQTLTSQLTMASQQQPELHREFTHNAEAQHIVATSTGSYIAALELFCDGLETFCKKTVPDTLNTIRQLEHARLIYDAYRNELDRMESKANKSASPSTTTQQGAGDETSTVALEGSTDISHNPPSNPAPQQEVSIQQLRQKFSKSREDYLALKSVTDVKMKLLHENRARAIGKHLQALQAATLSYYANGYRDLGSSLKALSEREASSDLSLPSHNQAGHSFLETESPSPINKKSIYFTPENGDAEHQQRDVFQD